MNLTFAYPWVIALGVPLIILACIWHLRWRKATRYQFALTSLFRSSKFYAPISNNTQRVVRFALRILILVLLVLATARPQTPDERSKIDVEGISIMLVIDASGSMDTFDDLNNQKPRLSIAKEEAIKFINRRPNDQIGLVIFGADAASRCPLTADKKIIADSIRDTKIGILNPDGTVLSKAIAMGVNRLRTSPLTSKIMVILTDGEPTPGKDIDPSIPLELAKKTGVKLYTIGIGSDKGGYLKHPFYGLIQMPTPLNKELLDRFARETGGKFYVASKQEELEKIYCEIDALEKSEHQTPTYAVYYEYYAIPLLVAFILLLLEIILSLAGGIVL